MRDVELSTLIPNGIFVGTSLILPKGDRFLFGMRPQKTEAGRQVLEITGIGGGLEAEDASYMAGAIREAREEIDSAIWIGTSDETLIIRDGQLVEKVRLSSRQKPAAIVFRNHRTPAHQPWHAENQGEACLLVFSGRLKEEPAPSLEIPSLIWLRPEEILDLARRDIRLDHLLSVGVELIVGPERPPMHGLARLTDSQEALALALGDETVAFYNSMA